MAIKYKNLEARTKYFDKHINAEMWGAEPPQ